MSSDLCIHSRKQTGNVTRSTAINWSEFQPAKHNWGRHLGHWYMPLVVLSMCLVLCRANYLHYISSLSLWLTRMDFGSDAITKGRGAIFTFQVSKVTAEKPTAVNEPTPQYCVRRSRFQVLVSPRCEFYLWYRRGISGLGPVPGGTGAAGSISLRAGNISFQKFSRTSGNQGHECGVCTCGV